ncbi:MAG TPA: hypothetical protein PKE26_14445 [Kiritimatiellia bacterium]|nr:hypothetical protein [Kiritimatiellia bacterium]HMP00300.1 hypothetical protein [Kiritimatiellia bacterium]
MNTQPDFEEFLSLLKTHRVEYMLVGGYAVAFHGYPRFTKDLDVFYRRQTENVARLRAALVAFGFGQDDVNDLTLETEGEIIRFGVAPVMIDLINHIDGVTYEEADPHVVEGCYGNTPARFIGREHLLKNKRATPRAKDKVDANELE